MDKNDYEVSQYISKRRLSRIFAKLEWKHLLVSKIARQYI